jgi:CheY-like chemotaxis protein
MASMGERDVRILVVDEDASIRCAIARLLRGHSLVLCDGAISALAVLERGEPFDIVFCDVALSDDSGLDLYRHLRTHRPDIADRFVFLTGGPTSPAAEGVLTSGRHRVPKPFSSDDLVAAIEHVARDGAGAAYG